MRRKVILILAVLSIFLTASVISAPAAPPEKLKVLIGFKEMPGASEEALVRAHGGEIRYRYRIVPVIAADLPQSALTNLESVPGVKYIEEDGIVKATTDTIPWGVDRIDAELVWPLGNTGSGVKVAILDTGIDYTHPDLNDNYQGGYDYVNGDPDPMDDEGHGTHVAGIVAAEADGNGVIGVAPDAGLISIKVLDSSGNGYISDLIAGIQFAVDNDADIINMSLGTNSHFQALQDACDSAYNNYNTVLVAAAGNDGFLPGDTVDYPAAYGSVIAVGATDNTDSLAVWSSKGPDLDIVAPGVFIFSTYLGGGYANMGGTSMASPHVAGTAALIIASGINGAADVRQTLTESADDLGAPGYDELYGWGLVDAYEALGPFCDIRMSQSSYLDGETVTASILRVANPDSEPVPIEFKVWIGIPDGQVFSMINVGADGSIILPSGFDQDLGPLPLFQVDTGLPRGTYEFSCRMLHPVTGKTFTVDQNYFEIQ